jgi:hypothetical protein
MEGAEAGAEFMYTTALGTEVKIPVTPDMTEADLMAEINTAELEAEAAIMGEAIANALSSVGITPESLQEAVNAATSETAITTDVTPTLSSDAYSVI